MNLVACAIRIICLGCVITLSGLPAGEVGLVCPDALMAEDLAESESATIQAGPLNTIPPGRDRLLRRKSSIRVVSRRVCGQCPRLGWSSRFCFAGHQLANGLNAPLRI